MRPIRCVALAALLAMTGSAMAEVLSYRAPGDLAPVRPVGCLATDAITPEMTPPDLGYGVLACADAGRWDAALEMYVAMQLFAVFDARRVSDVSAHQAGQVLSLEVPGAIGAEGLSEFQAAFARFGDSGSPRHRAFCGTMRALAPPSYRPDYMIAHGMGAFLGRDDAGLVTPFDADTVWAALLSDYLKCD